MAASGPGLRLARELAQIARDGKMAGVSAAPYGTDDLKTIGCSIQGPDDSPYEGGTFKIHCEIPSDYPFVPPKMRFVTKVWHPNVSSQTGAICLDILKDEWTPALTLQTALLSIRALLTAAEPSDPQDAQVARQYLSDRAAFDATARDWTTKYAGGAEAATPPEVVDPRVLQLEAMGFDSPSCKAAIAQAGGEVERAIAILLSGAS